MSLLFTESGICFNVLRSLVLIYSFILNKTVTTIWWWVSLLTSWMSDLYNPPSCIDVYGSAMWMWFDWNISLFCPCLAFGFTSWGHKEQIWCSQDISCPFCPLGNKQCYFAQVEVHIHSYLLFWKSLYLNYWRED